MTHQAEPEAHSGDGAAAAGTGARKAGAAEALAEEAAEAPAEEAAEAAAQEAVADGPAAGRSAAEVEASADARPETGEPRVDAALKLLDQLEEQPVTEHAAVFEQVHAELTAVLGQIDPESAGTDG